MEEPTKRRELMITEVYFVRHAQPDMSIHDDASRPLTQKGITDSKLVTRFFKDKSIDLIFSSPYKRAFDTVLDFSNKVNLPITCIENFRERGVDKVWIEDFIGFVRKQWDDFTYKLSAGESLQEVQTRNITGLKELLELHRGKSMVVGTHGTALSTIINYYDKSFHLDQFFEVINLMPWLVKMTFEENDCINIEHYNLFDNYKV
jgi:2,3-bisphosphoglycerate-dependent phosphoglycerate mutase